MGGEEGSPPSRAACVSNGPLSHFSAHFRRTRINVKNFVTRQRKLGVTVLSRRNEDRSRYMPHCGKKEYLKAWKRVLRQRGEFDEKAIGNEV